MIKRFLAVTAMSAAVVGASAGAAFAQYPPAAGTGAVSATTIVVGHHVSFAGGGYAPGSSVTVSVNGALYATVVALGPAGSALGDGQVAHFQTAAYAQPVAATTSASFTESVTLNEVGKEVLTGSGVDPAGQPRTVRAVVVVVPATVKATASASSLPFTGSSVIIPGAIIGLTMVAGGFVLLTSVRARRAGARS